MPDGRRAVSTSYDRTLRIWDLESGQTVCTLEGNAERVDALAITPDGRHIVSASHDRTLRLWDLENFQTVRTLEGHTKAVTAVAITPDGRLAVSASRDRDVATVGVGERSNRRGVRRPYGTRHRYGGNTRRAAAPSRPHAIATLRVWDLESGQTVRTLEGHTKAVTAVAITLDGRRAVSASYDRALRVWDLETGQTLRTLEGHKKAVTAVAVTPDGLRAVSGGWDRTLRVWDLESGQTVRTLEGSYQRRSPPWP